LDAREVMKLVDALEDSPDERLATFEDRVTPGAG